MTSFRVMKRKPIICPHLIFRLRRLAKVWKFPMKMIMKIYDFPLQKIVKSRNIYWMKYCDKFYSFAVKWIAIENSLLKPKKKLYKLINNNQQLDDDDNDDGDEGKFI